MKLEVKDLFPTSSTGSNFYIYQLPKSLGMSKVLPHGVRMQKTPKTRTKVFWIFTDFHGFSWSYVGPKSNLHPRTEISSFASLTPKSSDWCVGVNYGLHLMFMNYDWIPLNSTYWLEEYRFFKVSLEKISIYFFFLMFLVAQYIS